MAFDYDGANNGVFTHIGKLVKHYNQFHTDATHASTGLDADRDEVMDAFQLGDQDIVLGGLVADYERYKSEYVQRKSDLSDYVLKRLQDVSSVLNEIGASSSDQEEILDKLISQMNVDTETILESSVSLGSISPDGDNTGNGTILSTKVLDGVTSPGEINDVTMAAHDEYSGLNSELCVPSETWRLRVTADSYQDGLTEGSEEILWEGDVADQQHGLEDEGSGSIATITPINGAGILTDGDLENFTSNDPDSWDIDDGTAGTHIFKETTAADVYHGSSSLKFDSTASPPATIGVSQAVSNASVVGDKAYCVSAYIKADATIGSGDLLIQFEGTGYTASSSEKISIAPGSLPTSWTLKHFFIVMPDVIPSDFKLVLRWANNPTASKKLWIDDVALGPVNYGGGAGVVAVRGSTPFVRNDRFSMTVTNTEAVFQKFFRQVFGVQLPSKGTPPSILESLAQ